MILAIVPRPRSHAATCPLRKPPSATKRGATLGPWQSLCPKQKLFRHAATHQWCRLRRWECKIGRHASRVKEEEHEKILAWKKEMDHEMRIDEARAERRGEAVEKEKEKLKAERASRKFK